MTGCWVAWKCLVACWLGESSQQPTWPQVRQSRKCSHLLPLFRHSSQPSALGVTLRMPAMWLQPFATGSYVLGVEEHHIGATACKLRHIRRSGFQMNADRPGRRRNGCTHNL